MGRIEPGVPRPLPAGRGSATAVASALCAALAGTACGSDSTAKAPVRPEVDLHHPSGSIRARAVAAVAQRRDTTHVPALIDALEDEDPAVRLSASRTLRELTGHDTGYKAYMSPEERHRHADLWRAWWASRGAARPASSAPAPGVPSGTPKAATPR